MARRRMIEVSIAHDKKLNALSDFGQLLFLKMLPHTDDFGRFEGDPVLVKARVDPLSKKPAAKYEAAMREIAAAGLWTWFKTPEGKMVVQYHAPSFERINAFLIKQRGNNEYPPFVEGYELISSDMPVYPIYSNKQKVESRKQEAESKESDKKKFGDFVTLTAVEYDSLILKLGSKKRADAAIEILDNAKGAKGYTYKSDYRAILSWVLTELVKRESNGKAGSVTTKRKREKVNGFLCGECGEVHKLDDVCPKLKAEAATVKSTTSIKGMVGSLTEAMRMSPVVQDPNEKYRCKKCGKTHHSGASCP